MTLLAIKLFLGGALKRLLSAFTALWGWATKNPVAALCIVLALSTVWFWRADRKHTAERNAARSEIASLKAAAKENARLALEQKRAWEAKSATIAKEAQDAYETDLAEARTATDTFIRANRVRPERVCRGNPAPARESESPAVPPGVSTDTFVAVSDADVLACTGAATYAVAAHNAAMKQIADGLAER